MQTLLKIARKVQYRTSLIFLRPTQGVVFSAEFGGCALLLFADVLFRLLFAIFFWWECIDVSSHLERFVLVIIYYIKIKIKINETYSYPVLKLIVKYSAGFSAGFSDSKWFPGRWQLMGKKC